MNETKKLATMMGCALALSTAASASADVRTCGWRDAPTEYTWLDCFSESSYPVCEQRGEDGFIRCELDVGEASSTRGAEAYAATEYGRTMNRISIFGVDGEGAPFCCNFRNADAVRQIHIVGTDGADVIELSADGHQLEPVSSEGTMSVYVYGERGVDTIDGSDSEASNYTETLRGGRDTDIIHGGRGDDRLYGDDGVDYLYGDEGDDQIWGGAGNDQWLRGGWGDDTIHGGTGDDGMSGGAGDDTLYGGTGDDTMSGADDDDVLRGGDGDDLLSGGGGIDHLNGGAGADEMRGGAGDDVLCDDHRDADLYSGGAGQDLLWRPWTPTTILNQSPHPDSSGEDHDTWWGDACGDARYGFAGCETNLTREPATCPTP